MKPKFVEPKAHYTRPTISQLTKDRELTRIIDEEEKRSKSIYVLTSHMDHKKGEQKQMSDYLNFPF